MKQWMHWSHRVAAIVVVLGAHVASADQITVKDHLLNGKVVGLTPVAIDGETTVPGLAFESEFGKGNLLIPFAEMTSLDTDAEFYVLHGDEAESMGRLVGVVDGALLVGSDAANAERIPVDTIHSIVSKAKYDGSWFATLKSRYRHWTASADVGFSLTEATTDQRSFSAGLRADRRKAPTRFLTSLTSRYGTQSRRGGPKSATDDLLKGLMKLEYDLTPELFTYGQADATYDGIQKLSLRAVPELGLGYRLYKTASAFFQVEAGGAYVYERYFGGSTDEKFSVAFGLEAGAKLPGGMIFNWTADYFPAVEDFTGDYLLRTEASLLVPMYSFLSAKLGLVDEYDSIPAADASPNRFTTTAGLALVF